MTLMCAVVGGCAGKEDPVAQDVAAEAVAQDFRSAVDTLGARIGEQIEVRQDELTSCIPNDEDSGKRLVYFISVKAPDGTYDRLTTDVATDLEAEGWVVKARGPTDVGFTRDDMHINVNFAPDQQLAALGGSSACSGP